MEYRPQNVDTGCLGDGGLGQIFFFLIRLRLQILFNKPEIS